MFNGIEHEFFAALRENGVQMELEDVYKEHYFFELTRRNELISQLNIPIGILTVLLGAVTIITTKASYDNTILTFVIFSLIALSFVFAVFTAYYLIRSYYGFSYNYVPTPKEIDDYKRGLSLYYTSSGENDVSISEAKEYLKEKYVSCAHKNTTKNESRSAYMHNANTNLVGMLILVALSSIMFFIKMSLCDNRTNSEEGKTVTICSKCEDRLMTKEAAKPAQTQPQQPQQQAAPSTPMVKPTPPPERVVKENVQPKKD